jgi:hypothetical protein
LRVVVGQIDGTLCSLVVALNGARVCLFRRKKIHVSRRLIILSGEGYLTLITTFMFQQDLFQISQDGFSAGQDQGKVHAATTTDCPIAPGVPMDWFVVRRHRLSYLFLLNVHYQARDYNEGDR